MARVFGRALAEDVRSLVDGKWVCLVHVAPRLLKMSEVWLMGSRHGELLGAVPAALAEDIRSLVDGKKLNSKPESEDVRGLVDGKKKDAITLSEFAEDLRSLVDRKLKRSSPAC